MTPVTTAARSVELTTILLILASTALFGIGDALVKLMSEIWPVPQIILFRSIFCIAFLLAVRPRGEPVLPSGIVDRNNILRSLCEIGVTFSFFVGAALMPLGTAVTLMFLSPILLTALAALVLHEQVGWRRWVAVLTGFAGVLIVTRPGGEAWTAVSLLPLLAAVFLAGRDIIVRKLPPAIGNRAVVLATSLALGLVSAVTAPVLWQPIGLFLILGSLACAATVTAAFLCYVHATRIAEISFIQPLKYLAIPYSFALGYIFWGDLPDRIALLGASMIVASGLFIIHRKRTLEAKVEM